MLKVLYVLSWIIFIGLCIEAGGIIFNTFFTMVLNPEGAKRLWKEVDLSALYQYDAGHFLTLSFLIIITTVLKALLFYLIVKLLYDKKLSLSQPFNREVGRFIYLLSCLSLAIGLFSYSGVNYAGWLAAKAVSLPAVQNLRLGGADVWLFMGIILLVIAQLFKRGIEMQTENELTV